MSQAIVDPNELRRFAGTLRRFSAEAQNQMSILHGQLQSLGRAGATKSIRSSSRNSNRR